MFDWATSSPKHFFDVIIPVWLKEDKNKVHARQEKNYAEGCSCESCESDYIILKSAFFCDFHHHVDEGKKGTYFSKWEGKRTVKATISIQQNRVI